MKTSRKILIGIAALIGAAVLIPIVRHYQLKAAVVRYRAELKAKGKSTELVQVLPPTALPEQNGAEQIIQAITLLNQHPSFLTTNPVTGKKRVAPGKAMVNAAQPIIREQGKFGFTNTWAAAETDLQENQEALTLLHAILVKTNLDFHVPYANGFADFAFFTNLHLAELKKSASLLSSAAIVDLQRGDTGAAITNARAALALAHAMREQRLVISELVRIAIVSIAQNPTWEILQSERVTDRDLAGLQADWERLDFLRSYQNALAMEWIIGDGMLATWRKSNAELEKRLELGKAALRSMGAEDDEGSPSLFQRAKTSANIFMWRYWWSYPDELRSLRGGEVLLETVRQAETNHAFVALRQQQQAKLESLGLIKSLDKLENPLLLLETPDLHSMLSESIITLSGCFKKITTIETMKRTTITAIALKRYQLRHGNYPETLAELAPEFLASVPLDPVDGQPLRYRRNADGSFLLYSVGGNGKDDGGDPSLEPGVTSSNYAWQNDHVLDWVWPQPATDAEINYFYAHPPK